MFTLNFLKCKIRQLDSIVQQKQLREGQQKKCALGLEWQVGDMLGSALEEKRTVRLENRITFFLVWKL